MLYFETMKQKFMTMMITATAAFGSLSTTALAQNEVKDDFKYTDEQFADIQMLRYKVEGFEKLTLKEKTFIYYLQEAALQGRDILFDQNGRYNLRIRRMLEAVYTDWQGDRKGKFFTELTTYLKQVWFSSGIHHHYGCEKFTPGFTADELRAVPGQFTPSAFVASVTGVDNVCERSAVKASGGMLLLPKTAGGGVTLALAVRPFAPDWRTEQ